MAREPQAGEVAPDFQLDTTQGKVRLADSLERGAVLLVFYPGDDTPVCTRQLCDYRDNLALFENLGVRVIAINSQPLDSHHRFAERYALPFPLASDPERTTCRAYGAVGLLGTTKRSLFLVGRDGRVQYQRTDLPIFRRTAEELERVIAKLDL